MDSVQLTQIIQSWNNNLFIQAATVAWFLYDYVLTFSNEIRYIWSRQFSSVGLIFLFARYAAFVHLLKPIENFVQWNRIPKDDIDECGIIWRINAIVELIYFMSLTVLATLRVYAISRGNMKASLAVLCLSTTFIFCDGIISISGTILPRPFSSGCYQIVTLGGQIDPVLGIHVSNPVYLILGHSHFGRLSGKVWYVSTPYDDDLIPKSSQQSSVDLSPFNVPRGRFFSIMTCRAIIQLNQVKLADTSETGTGTKSYIVARFIGNVGAPLDLSRRDEEDATNEDGSSEDIIYEHADPLIEGLRLSAEFESNNFV
ncbi:hypothetical protein EIP86_003174 [Pleurotus ostreatoroseus]|nr:hypothetical protein EIP86_003174 [Pleurotus ostreatoroseus]